MGFFISRKKTDKPPKEKYAKQKAKLPDGYQISVEPTVQWNKKRYIWRVMKNTGKVLRADYAESEKGGVSEAVKWALRDQSKKEHLEGRHISF